LTNFVRDFALNVKPRAIISHLKGSRCEAHMRKFFSILALTLTLAFVVHAAQQARERNVANVTKLKPKVRPAADVDPPSSSLDDTLRWIQQRFPAPFQVDVQAGGHLQETVSYSTVLVDWKGCSAHFRSDREHTINGEIDKHTVDQIIPLGDVDPDRIQPYPLQVPGLIWDVPGISISTAYERPTIIDTFQSPRQNSYYTNLTFTDASGNLEAHVIAALRHAVEICGGRPGSF
jgi:hypothetical protein